MIEADNSPRAATKATDTNTMPAKVEVAMVHGAETGRLAQKSVDSLVLPEPSPTDIFLTKYDVIVHNEHAVSFVIPIGSSRIEIMEEAHGLVTERLLFYPGQLNEWSTQPRFTTQLKQAERIHIDGHVEGGDARSSDQQHQLLSAQNMHLGKTEDVAVAFAVYWIATGNPLFQWDESQKGSTYRVRVDESRGYDLPLMMDKFGLHHVYAPEDDCSKSMAVAGRL